MTGMTLGSRAVPHTGHDEAVPLYLPLLRERFDPDPDLRRLRDARPVARLDVPDDVPPVWLVTGHDEVRRVLGDPAVFSNDLRHLAGTGLEALAAQDPGGLGFTDPPDHTRLRRLLTPEFTARRLQELQPSIDAVVATTIDVLVEQGPPADLAAGFAVPVPSLVICELLGVPEEDRVEMERRSVQRFDVLGSVADSLSAVAASLDYLTGLVATYRRDPRPGLLGRLLLRHGDELSDRELAELADGLLTGGHDTTSSMLALGVLTLLERPELADRLRSGDLAVGPFVEELLRHLSVVQVAFPRYAQAAARVGGVDVEVGDIVICSLSAANRDAVFGGDPERGDPEQMDPARPTVPHLAFGYGIHRCLGAELGRMELRTALPELLRRLPGLRLAVPAQEVEFRTISLVHGVRSLPVAW
jgi:cytochrome P450